MAEQPTHMTNRFGHLVPVEMVKAVDLARDGVVNEIAEAFLAERDRLRALKRVTMGSVDAWVDLSAEEYGVHVRGVAGKGNITLTSYDGRFKVIRSVAEQVAFDERLQAARVLIDQCLAEWSADARPEIQAIVARAFRTDAEGRVSAARVLELRATKIDHEAWRQAMQAIADSVHVSGTKPYVRVYERQPDGRYEAISLDLATL